MLIFPSGSRLPLRTFVRGKARLPKRCLRFVPARRHGGAALPQGTGPRGPHKTAANECPAKSRRRSNSPPCFSRWISALSAGGCPTHPGSALDCEHGLAPGPEEWVAYGKLRLLCLCDFTDFRQKSRLKTHPSAHFFPGGIEQNQRGIAVDLKLPPQRVVLGFDLGWQLFALRKV